jgi:Uri superfamily endonuclease
MSKMYKTTNVALATALATSGFAIEGFDRSDNDCISFLFEINQNLIDSISAFSANKLMVDAQSFAINYEGLNKYMHNSNL